MATAEERLRILKMIEEGKITAEQGAQLIEALSEKKPPMPPEMPVRAGAGRGARWFLVRITDTNTGKTRVNVRIPVSLISAGMKMGARFSPQVEGLDMDVLMQYIQSGETGKIVDVFDDKDGEHVQVFIE
jgi:hypothetical protein